MASLKPQLLPMKTGLQGIQGKGEGNLVDRGPSPRPPARDLLIVLAFVLDFVCFCKDDHLFQASFYESKS